MIGEGPPMYNKCAGFGSIILETPLDRDFPIDTLVYALPLPFANMGDTANAPLAPPPRRANAPIPPPPPPKSGDAYSGSIPNRTVIFDANTQCISPPAIRRGNSYMDSPTTVHYFSLLQSNSPPQQGLLDGSLFTPPPHGSPPGQANTRADAAPNTTSAYNEPTYT